MGTVTTKLMSLAEFERLDTSDQVELLNGELVRMPPAEFSHNDSAETLRDLIKSALDQLRKSHPDFRFGKVHHEMGYLFPGEPPSWLQPDVSIAHHGQPLRKYYEGAPFMAFEIVSEHDNAKDLDRKVGLYLMHGAAEVWVIYPETRHAVVYHGMTQGITMETNAIHSELLPGVEIPFADFLN